ncbi:MAG: OmpA family protein, partial [Georgfuchsia sp.]
SRQAMFARCIPPACPTRTPKTLALETPSPPLDRAVLPAPAEPVAPDPVAQNPLPKTETSHTVTVQFAFGSAWLSPTAQSRLEAAVADIATAHSVTISGRTDSMGPLSVNEALALARAHAVRNYLFNQHPALTAALSIQAQGACCFIAPNDTLVGRARNRRVEVVFRMTEEDPP